MNIVRGYIHTTGSKPQAPSVNQNAQSPSRKRVCRLQSQTAASLDSMECPSSRLQCLAEGCKPTLRPRGRIATAPRKAGVSAAGSCRQSDSGLCQRKPVTYRDQTTDIRSPLVTLSLYLNLHILKLQTLLIIKHYPHPT